MKIKIISLTILLFGLSSCDLDEELNDSLTIQASNQILGPTQALKSAYNQLWSFQQTDFQFMLQEHPSDEMAGPTRGGDWDDNGVWRSLHTHTWSPDNVRVISAWEQLNKGLYFAINAQSFPGITPSQKAQGVFLQCLYTFYITDLFGQVSMRISGESVSGLPSIQLKRTEAIDYAINLLEAQLPNLPDGTAMTADVASKNAGNALLAKMYLNRAVYKATDANGMPQIGPFTFSTTDMDKVISYSDAAMVGRSLQTNYFENFAPNNGEISNELIFTSKNTNQVGGDMHRFYFMTLHYNQRPGGWNGFVALTDLYDKFDDKANDKRFSSNITGLTNVSGLTGGFLIGQQFNQLGVKIKERPGGPTAPDLVFTQNFTLANSTEEKGMRIVKYQPDYSSLERANNDFIFLRLSDVMLIKAEAQARKGNLADALTIINTIRTTRGAAALPSMVLKTVLDERARELYWEGHRRQDQIRFSTFNQPVQERSTTTDRHVLIFPIPLANLAANPNLKQNPGY
jgi:starch-binding outer membrane protein, SusD/RagB family